MASSSFTSTSRKSSTQKMMVTKTVTKTGPDGKTVTETFTEEREVNDDGIFQNMQPKLKLSAFDGAFGKDGNNGNAWREVTDKDKQADESSSSSSSSSEDEDDDQEFSKLQREGLEANNKMREKHGVKPLKLTKKLCDYAQEWADKLAKEDRLQHRTNNKYGENLYSSWSSDPKAKVSTKEAMESWYSEIAKYTFGQEPRGGGTGHFTQCVWKASEELGIGIAKSASGKKIVVGNYKPAGNFMGKYNENVPAPL